ncbi:hypothetical protein MKY14_28410 [Paenibacillus sp. FSL R5-0887]|jgi:hypothetical protein|uniref:hypothetical protein n=1 Tax=Paenibacillus TaxID=44249 RepID=UPI00096E8092|nr:hypothetical protein [Paenibacillus odorifer]OME09132.1 hypothetical protein BSK64_01150 [Paenibacillus odorifer]
MSAFAEYAKEQQEIDGLLFKGYMIASIQEDLDGARIKFVRGEPAKSSVELLLLTADARKYVTTLVVAGLRAEGEQAGCYSGEV